MVPDFKLRLGLSCHTAEELAQATNVLNENVDNITSFQVNPEPLFPREKEGGGFVCCWWQGVQITFVLCRACPRFACLPGALLTRESSSSIGFQAGDSQIPIPPAPQLSTEAQVPAGVRAQPLLPPTNLCLAQPGPVLLSLGGIKS